MVFSRQEYWCGLPFPSPGDLPDPEMETGSPALQADFFTTEPPGKPYSSFIKWIIIVIFFSVVTGRIERVCMCDHLVLSELTKYTISMNHYYYEALIKVVSSFYFHFLV